ncbi:alpha/beta hydrolase [Motiliproteus sediminis]|uniref:alpha/beta hydrolase n=1 Tax=Motiliproteus sediminis TaxID=1468178 RepID=UPI001AEF9D09|nr:alpha/beta hydrolase [Motiliproteus sediminis]
MQPSDPNHSVNRQRILKQLGLDRYLTHRTCWELGELPLHCELYPADPHDPLVIFIPGIGTYSEIYTEFLYRFSQRGYNLLSIDLRGHGYSGGPRGDYSVEEVIRDLGQVIDYARQHFDGPLVLFGCSIGARLGLAFAEADSRLDALICHTLFLNERPPDLWHMLGWSWLSMNAMWMPQLKTDFRQFVDVNALLEHNPMGQFASQDSLLVWEYPLRTLNSAYSHPSRILQQPLGIPALLLFGEKDHVLPPDYLRSLAGASKQPFTLIEIADAGHMLPFDHIEETLEATDNWLKNNVR